MPYNGRALPGLKEARLRKAMTQTELAQAAGVATSTVGRLETTGLAAPATIRKLAAVLGVAPDALMAPEPEALGKALAA